MMETARHNRWRSVSAGICLLAVLFLYTPLVTSSWSAYGPACCAFGQCPIKEHHHHLALPDLNQADSNHSNSNDNSNQPNSKQNASNDMDCHHEMAGMMACNMSCCRNPETPAVASAIFVLPLPFTLSAPASFKSNIVSLQAMNFLRTIEPLSPPPRFLSALA
jgi:hypothetical protein